MEPTKEEKPTPNFIEEKMREFDERFPRVELKSFLRQALEEAREVGRDDCCVSRLGCLCTVKNCNGEGCRCPEHYVKHEEWLSELIKSREEAIAEERRRIEEEIQKLPVDFKMNEIYINGNHEDRVLRFGQKMAVEKILEIINKK